MQLTRFDRWLREKYVYQTQIHTLRPVESLPSGVRAVKSLEISGQRYKFLYVANRSKAADKLIARLKEAGQMYTTKVVDRQLWYVPFIAPKAKSVTWWFISLILTVIFLILTLAYLNHLLEDPEMRGNLRDSFKILDG